MYVIWVLWGSSALRYLTILFFLVSFLLEVWCVYPSGDTVFFLVFLGVRSKNAFVRGKRDRGTRSVVVIGVLVLVLGYLSLRLVPDRYLRYRMCTAKEERGRCCVGCFIIFSICLSVRHSVQIVCTKFWYCTYMYLRT